MAMKISSAQICRVFVHVVSEDTLTTNNCMEGECIAQGIGVVLVFLAVIVDECDSTFWCVPEIKVQPGVFGIPVRARQYLAPVSVVAVGYLGRGSENASVVVRNPCITGLHAHRRLIKDKIRWTWLFKEQRRIRQQAVDFRRTRALSNLQVFASSDEKPAVLRCSTRVPDAGVRQVRARLT